MKPWTNMRIEFSDASDYGWFVEYNAEFMGVRIGCWEVDDKTRQKVDSDSVPEVPADLSHLLIDAIEKVISHEKMNEET